MILPLSLQPLLSPPKCSIAVEKIEFLSHIVTGGKVEPSPDKVKVIVDIASSKTLSQANKFIGKVRYYRKFIRDFAKIAVPIHKVTNKTRPKKHEFRWDQQQQDAFDQFKSILTSAPLFLDFPDRSVPFILSTDASVLRIAGIHLQDLIPQIIEIQYRRGIDNIGPDYLTRYDTIGTDNQQQSLFAITRLMTKQVAPSASLPPTVTEQNSITTPPLSTSTPIADFSS
ncbi:unnamed protein product [Didymodactylos carnosus]|uniref:Reverse transcriptase/retrotransposon-derived protein RNase H-like domain-containing protein n=1 Tax=Didymodactylos carnosus TaxID=1234261 RepID=A0A8S2V7M9_9BILA|nr:unnamed protein product [Didymodactylos carnosus]